MDLNALDAKLFALITASTVAAVFVAKKIFKWAMDGKEEVLAVVLPVLFVVIAKACHAFHGTDWVDALLWALASGGAAGISHDYGAKPFVELFKKKSEPIVPVEKDPPAEGEPKS